MDFGRQTNGGGGLNPQTIGLSTKIHSKENLGPPLCVRPCIQVKFFTFDQNVGKSLKRISTKIEHSTSCRFQDIAVQSQQASFYFSAAILPVL